MKCLFYDYLQIMSRLDCWGLDVFKVSDLSQERPLTVTTFTIFQVNAYIFAKYIRLRNSPFEILLLSFTGITSFNLFFLLTVKRSFQVLSNSSSNLAKLSHHLGKPLSEECTLSQQSSCS